jgi:predicted aspartyl protease
VNNVIKLLDSTKIEFERIKGHINLKLSIAREGGTNEDAVNFIYDTGAVITVISRDTYELYGLDKLPRSEASMPGYTGSAPGWVYTIPGIAIGRRAITGVYAFSPKDYELGQNLLADNVIEYFNVYQDNENDCLYFMDNPKPLPLIYEIKGSDGKPTWDKFSLGCSGIYFTDD